MLQENAHLEEQLRFAQNRLSGLTDDHEEVQERLLAEKADIEKERKANADLLDELSKELEELRNFKIDHDSKTRGAGAEVPRSQRRQFETHITALRQVISERQSGTEGTHFL